MPIPDLPAELKVALEEKAHGLSRSDAARRSASISQSYRNGGNSRTITTQNDALAYALVRMPATYAAVAASLDAVCKVRGDFAPTSLLDVGAGPGTATWAAAEFFSSLEIFTLLDANPALRTLALDLFQTSGRFSSMDYAQGNARTKLTDASPADLVIASYILGEMNDAGCTALSDAMWAKTRDTLLLIEPGTPAGYARILRIRTRLIAQGAHVVAPCPHDHACPLIAPDWCHFSQRLARSRAHIQIKGAELPYENEKFIYVTLSRAPAAQNPARVLTQPDVTKIAVTAKLCTQSGVEIANVPRRDKEAFTIARKWNWGDGFSNPAGKQRE